MFVVVIEPGARSIQTYKNVKRLAEGSWRIIRYMSWQTRYASEEDEAVYQRQDSCRGSSGIYSLQPGSD